MRVEKTALQGVMIIVPDVFTDERGIFMETFQEKRYQEVFGSGVKFVQDNFSVSKKNVLRGLHYQANPLPQAKLVQVLQGRAFDVAVDLRKSSPTFGKYVGVELSAENHRQFFIPAGCIHGFLSLEEGTMLGYKCTNIYVREHECGVRWDDPDLAIAWGTSMPILSEKDSQLPFLKDVPSEHLFA